MYVCMYVCMYVYIYTYTASKYHNMPVHTNSAGITEASVIPAESIYPDTDTCHIGMHIHMHINTYINTYTRILHRRGDTYHPARSRGSPILIRHVHNVHGS